MFHHAQQELTRLQEQLDRERELLERARKAEEIATSAPAKFCMTDLFAIIPDCDYTPMRIGASR